ncbi:UNVERIFIED_CONTAM: Pirin-like protein [Sesamum angustifolium]|uniref:glycerophosphodiester phosphodiesterase n=1 Tax=Sesamum angustifolium TaxID=2727405 RepID=A0AAW2PBL9_9LAMI
MWRFRKVFTLFLLCLSAVSVAAQGTRRRGRQWQTLSANLLVISSEGASGDYPGCTDEAYIKAVSDGVDILDCPVQLTSDGIPFCLGSINLKEKTNAGESNFTNLSTTNPDLNIVDGILAYNLTWSQIMTLKPAISNPYSKSSLFRNPAAQNVGKLMQLSDFLAFANNASSISGVLISIENAAYLAEKQGLGVTDAVLDALSKAGFIAGETSIVPKIQAFNLPVYVRLFRNEFVSQPYDFFSDAHVEINAHFAAGIDGAITDYPATAAKFKKAPSPILMDDDVAEPPLPPVTERPPTVTTGSGSTAPGPTPRNGQPTLFPSTILHVLAISLSTLICGGQNFDTSYTILTPNSADRPEQVEFMMVLEEKFGVSVGEGGAEDIATVQYAADLIDKIKQNKRTTSSVDMSEWLRRQTRNLLGSACAVSAPAGFPDHPHRGFETVTYMLQGAVRHEDFEGHSGTIEAGDLQWMTAGRGIVHSEMPASEGTQKACSCGLTSPLNIKCQIEPRYQELNSRDIAEASKDGVRVRVIAGEALGIKSPIYTRTPTMFLDFTLKPGSQIRQPIPESWNAFVYVLEGDGIFGTARSSAVSAHHLVLLGSGDGVEAWNRSSKPLRFILVGGEPLGEPVVQYGPFVMNSQEQIDQTIEDYENCANGFEKARHWKSESNVVFGY